MSCTVPSHLYVKCSNGLLAEYRIQESATPWESRWDALPEEAFRRALRKTGWWARFGRLFRRWLPRQGIVMDAGCGLGLWVSRLRHRGYHCVGVDLALDSLRRFRQLRPDLPFTAADVQRLPLPDKSISAYLSMGVVEHFEEGPGWALREAVRVLKNGGVALVSVPFLNALRQTVPLVDRSEAMAGGLAFHQHYFTREQLDKELYAAGLHPTGVFHGYGVGRVLSDSSIFWKRLLGGKLPIARLLDYVPFLPGRYAHMMFTVAVRT